MNKNCCMFLFLDFAIKVIIICHGALPNSLLTFLNNIIIAYFPPLLLTSTFVCIYLSLILSLIEY